MSGVAMNPQSNNPLDNQAQVQGTQGADSQTQATQIESRTTKVGLDAIDPEMQKDLEELDGLLADLDAAVIDLKEESADQETEEVLLEGTIGVKDHGSTVDHPPSSRIPGELNPDNPEEWNREMIERHSGDDEMFVDMPSVESEKESEVSEGVDRRAELEDILEQSGLGDPGISLSGRQQIVDSAKRVGNAVKSFFAGLAERATSALGSAQESIQNLRQATRGPSPVPDSITSDPGKALYRAIKDGSFNDEMKATLEKKLQGELDALNESEVPRDFQHNQMRIEKKALIKELTVP